MMPSDWEIQDVYEQLEQRGGGDDGLGVHQNSMKMSERVAVLLSRSQRQLQRSACMSLTSDESDAASEADSRFDQDEVHHFDSVDQIKRPVNPKDKAARLEMLLESRRGNRAARRKQRRLQQQQQQQQRQQQQQPDDWELPPGLFPVGSQGWQDQQQQLDERCSRLQQQLLQRMGLPTPQGLVVAAAAAAAGAARRTPPQAATAGASSSTSHQQQRPTASSTVGEGAGNTESTIDWSAWVPWFHPGCPLCVQEVQDLMAEQQQQQQAAAAGGARAEVPLRCRPGYHPWTAEAATTAAAAAAAAAGGGENGHAHPDHPSNNTSTSSSSSSSSPGGPWLSSCYGSWPVPWSCAFRYRRLLWRLLARLKPRAAAFYAQELVACPHSTDTSLWEHVVSDRASPGV
jgi:hypothetical protein